MKKTKFLIVIIFFLFNGPYLLAQSQEVKVQAVPSGNKVNIFIGDNLFTKYWYPDTLEKPILYPIYAPDGDIITRGFPINPQPGEPTDHPHQVGLWFTYENVNDLDFWNNSYAIPAERKSHYGWIRQKKILETKSGKTGVLKVLANWVNQKGDVLMQETTTFYFSGSQNRRMIDRITTLKAVIPVTFHDVKDGLIGLRVAKGLQSPDALYLNSEGKAGDAAWGTKARWCMLAGVYNGHQTNITIFDHKGNPGYPTWWHARGYGLFAANPLGEKIFSNGKDSLELKLDKGQSVTFKYRVAISNGMEPTVEEINQMADEFDKK